MPSARSRTAGLLALFAAASLVLAVFPVANHLRSGVNKDYPLWYATGMAVRLGFDLYPTDPGTDFPFMYPPFAAVLLAGLSLLGPGGMVAALVAGNVASWAACIRLSARLSGGPGPVPTAVLVVPSLFCLPFIYDMFLLGQPNLFLLALVLGGLACLRAGREVPAGGLLAAAAAVKAFPAVVLVYLLWRRHLRAAGAMVAFGAVFLVLVPAPVRGFDRAVGDLAAWADGMLLRNGEGGFGQRANQSLGWRNQSLFGVGHRLLRPVNAELEAKTPTPPVYVNLANLDHKTAGIVVLLAAGLLGLGYAALLPRRAARTPEGDAAEYGMLVVLTVVGTPYAFSYYFVWLLFPVAVLVRRGLDGATPLDRRVSWAALAVAGLLFAAAAPGWPTRVAAAAGAPFWAAAAILAGLGWHLWRAAPAGVTGTAGAGTGTPGRRRRGLRALPGSTSRPVAG